MWHKLKPWLVPEAVVSQDNDLERVIKKGLWVIALAFVGGGIWAATAQLSAAIVAPGVVKVDRNRKTIQHQEGGIVKQILVRDGDNVEPGQLLILLDDVRVDASVDMLRGQLDAEVARQARLLAEKSQARNIDFPGDLLARQPQPRVAESIQREITLFNARRTAIESQVALMQAQIRDVDLEVKGLTEQLNAETTAVGYAREELQANEGLIEKKFIANTRLLAFKRTVADYQARQGEHLAEIAKARQKETDLELRILSLRNNYVQTAADELKDSSNKIADLIERLRPSEDEARRQRIVAPVAGRVVSLQVHTVGAVLAPREPLLDIVPKDSPLLVEAKVGVDSINELHEGMQAEVRLTAYQQRTTPLVKGTVNYVSPDRLLDKEINAPYYTVSIALNAESLKEAGQLKPQPGMGAEVYIQTRARTALDYVLEPVTDSMRRAFREK